MIVYDKNRTINKNLGIYEVCILFACLNVCSGHLNDHKA